MAIDFGSTLNRLEHSLDIRLKRQDILSSNLANLDTPNFRPADLQFEGYLKEASDGAPMVQESAEVVKSDGPADSLDGNAVSLDDQVAKLDENRLRYGAALELVRRKLAILRYAAGMGNG